MIVCLKVGLLSSKDMTFHCVVGYFCLHIMDTFGHGLVGGFSEKNGLGLYYCALVQLRG